MGVDDSVPFACAGAEVFRKAAIEMGLPHDAGIVTQVEGWFAFYSSWIGRRVVGFTDPSDIAVKLITDSFAIFHAAPLPERGARSRVIDLGSGNGWPGLAARFLWTEGALSLLDSRLGACEFLERYVAWASLERVSVAPFRAEEAARKPEFRGRFDLVTTRAMAQPGVSLELSVPFARQGGLVALWLGPEYGANVSAKSRVPELGLSRLPIYEYSLPGGKGRRLLAVYRRESPPEKGFPRNLAGIKARPLL